MTNTTARCEPPPEWRDFQWHILESDREFWMGPPQPRAWQAPASWDAKAGTWWNNFDLAAASPAEAGMHGYRYIAPVTPPAVVAALVEALEGLFTTIDGAPWRDVSGLRLSDTVPSVERARAALALYRGEAGR